MTPVNPFPLDDPDRRAIWDMLILRDTQAFSAADWSMVEPDFCAGSFTGIRDAVEPAGWRIAFPTLESYRDAWLHRAASYVSDQLEGVSLSDFLFSASRLASVEIGGDRALALKLFEGDAHTVSGRNVELHWQTVYFLRKDSSAWRITGFVGYLPPTL